MRDTIVISGLSHVGPSQPQGNEAFNSLPFNTREALGQKGTRNMDRLTGLAISGMADLMPVLGIDRKTPHDDVGIVVGTAQGSMDSIVRFTYETLAYDRPDFVNPALFPNTVMNCAAGQAAIWYRLRGPNATISCHEMSFLAALEYSHLQLRCGSARTLITGSVEEYSEVSQAAATQIAQKLGVETRFSECATFFAVESADNAAMQGRTVLAEVLGISTGFDHDPESSEALSELIKEVLDDAQVSAAEVSKSVISGCWPDQRRIEHEAIVRNLGENATPLVSFDLYGNGGSAHNTLQLRQLLFALEPGGIGLLVAQERHGNIAALLIKKGKA